jgi:dimethylaniline monooxygenase (N-oxide forming)
MPRLFLQIFPPEYADSIAFLNTYNATDCAWVLGELCSMAIAQLWAGKSSFPSRERMETSNRRQMAFNASMWRRDHSVEKGVVRAGEFYQFIHAAAGTGLRKALGWGISGWRFSLGDREMAKLMNWGIVTPHMMRLIKTGKRKAWDGAREAIKKTNSEARNLDSVPQRFCLSELVASYE